MNWNARLLTGALVLCTALTVSAQTPSMIEGRGWTVQPFVTIGDTINGFTMPGIPDGMAAFGVSRNRALVLVNHELGANAGYPYQLANGTLLTGARVSRMIVERVGGQVTVTDARNAYSVIYDRQGNVVTNPAQVNETGLRIDGFGRFCSSEGVAAGTYNFVDDVYFANEEVGVPGHPHGGSVWAIDVNNEAIWALPALGRGAWENTTPVAIADRSKVALLLGDDTSEAPLYLYIGQKGARGDNSFLDRNGLAVGELFVWVADNGDLTPQQFNGEGSVRPGTWMPIAVRDAAMAGMPGHDAEGYRNNNTMTSAADAMGAFSFSRPEDLHVNPNNGSEAVFASTGRGQSYPADNWGTVYKIDLSFGTPNRATLTIIHDADGLPVPDEGIRSPDNLVWAKDGKIYINEDRSTSPSSLFGAVTGIEASVWSLDPVTLQRNRIGVIDRRIVLPVGTTDPVPSQIGNWETSGLIDVTDLFDTRTGETLLLVNVQAHSLRNGPIGGSSNLVEGGQIMFMSKDNTMLSAKTPATKPSGFEVEQVFTVGDTLLGYTPTGILDGMGMFPAPGAGRAVVTVTSELVESQGYPYSLANGTTLVGARVHRFLIERNGPGQSQVLEAGLAYDTIYDRQGQIVTNPAQINEDGVGIDGLARFCSAQDIQAGERGFADQIFFACEETGIPFHPHGGTMWALDMANRALWAVPALGRGAWENVTPLMTGTPNTIALILGDDTAGAPLYLYIGQKNALGNNSFLDRNGLAVGQLYAWVPDMAGMNTPQTFNGFGNTLAGTFVPVAVRDAAQAGQPGYDAEGYLNNDTLAASAIALGAFSFSRPEDVETNPANGTQFVFASTGRGQLFPADNWGTVYVVDVAFGAGNPTATFSIVHDADGLPVPDAGIRSPDNLTWATDGFVYVQEDKSTSPGSLFGAATGREASVWKLNPVTGTTERIAEMDRSVVLPVGTTDPAPNEIGNWESSGILDASPFLATAPGETLLLANVQAHSLRNGPIGGNANLVEGGQLVFLRQRGLALDITCQSIPGGAAVNFAIRNGRPGNSYFTAVTIDNAGRAPLGGFYGIDISIFDVLAFAQAPFLSTLDADGNAIFNIDVPGGICPFDITVDAVAIEISGTAPAGVVTSVSGTYTF